uniref:Uncharacterized protein n=1 Tax=Podoviridae sp. ctz6O13 TaxID=2827757 RepID=A0A8S5TK53_9CAUD|nr:MAG TPA: hypothetical protein [Podoviridae sp. ctz6O13]
MYSNKIEDWTILTQASHRMKGQRLSKGSKMLN